MSFPINAKPTDQLIVLESIYYLHRLGDHQAAELLLNESENQIAQSPLHQNIAQLLSQIAKYEQNKFDGKEFLPILTGIKASIQQAGLLLFEGWLYFLQGYYLKNADDLILAAKCFAQNAHHKELYEVYYWMDNYRLLPSEEKLVTFLRTYPVPSIYSLIKGNNYFRADCLPLTQLQKDQSRRWLKDQEDDEEFDCWLLNNKSITPAKYKTLELEDESYLDLYSGIINDRGEKLFLFLSELNCMAFLIFSEFTGAALPQLAEFINKTEKETEELILNLLKSGVKVQKKKDLYFIQWEVKPKIIIPRTLKVIGLQEFVKKKKETFTKSELIELLQVTQFGAEALMKKWALAGFIRPVEKKDQENIWKFI